MNNQPLIVKYDGKYFFPVFKYYSAADYGQNTYGDVNYRELKQKFTQENQGNWVLMPIYPYGPYESLTDLSGESPPNPPSRRTGLAPTTVVEMYSSGWPMALTSRCRSPY
jgi:microcin C transport system permease protein